MGIFGFGREKAPGSLSAEEIEKAIRYGFIDKGDEALAQKHPDYYRTLIVDKEKSIQSPVQGDAQELVPQVDTSGEVPSKEEEGEEEIKIEFHSGTRMSEKEGATANEDAVLALEEVKLFGVFDGMGGHAGGEIASAKVREHLVEVFKGLPEGESPEEIQEKLKVALHEANDELLKDGEVNPELRGMGTTASVIKLWEGPDGERKIIIANVGDSRVYVLRAGGEIEQATLDDGLIRREIEDEEKAKELQKKLNNTVDGSTLTDEEKYFFNKRNILSQCVGQPGMEPRISVVEVREGDRWVVASDGIHDNLTDIEIEEILREAKSSQEATEALINAAKERSREGRGLHPRSKKDDMSVVVVDFHSISNSEKETPSTPEAAPAKSEPVLTRKRFGFSWPFGKKAEKQKVENNPETAQSHLEKPEPESSVKPPEEVPTIAEPEEGKVVAEEGKKEEPIVSEQKDEVLPLEKISRDDEILPDTEKYGKTFELREKIKESRRARANLVIIEEELNRKRKWKFGISTKGVKELEAKYEKAKSNYEEKRAEYIGAKTWRLLKEKQRLAEAEARKYEVSHKGEKYFLEKWRKLGEKNLLTLLGKEGWNPTTRRGKAAKFLAKGLSARFAISSTLLGVGVLAGAGSVVGIGAFVGRRALSGVGSTVGTYDLLNLLGEKRNPDKTSELISRIENTPGEVTDEEIERKMAELEVKAKYKGERIVHSDEYEKLKKEYFKRVESKSDREDVIKKVLLELRLDKQVEAEKTKIEKVDARNKLIAGTVGTIVSTGALAEMLKYIRSIPGGEDVSIDEIERATQHGPALNEDTARALAEQEAALPDPTLDAAQKVCLVNPPGSESLIPRGLLPNVETPAVPPVPVDTPDNLVDVKILGGETITIAEDHIGVVKRGGSAWQAAREMVRSRAISQEEFARAWSSAASTVELPSGQTIHISDLALVHEGNQVLYIPEANGVPAHFEVADYAGKTLRVGSNADLARAFDAAGRPRPAWLERAVGAAQETAREAVTAPPTVDLPDIQPDLTPAGIDAANDSISISPEAVTDSADVGQVPNPEDVSVDTPEVPVEGTAGNDVIDRAAENAYESREALRFSWGGHVDIVYNAEGQIDGYIIDTENVSAFNKARVVERAVDTSFSSNYEEVLDASVRDSLRGALGEGPAFENGVAEIWPDVSAQAKELAFRIDTLRRVFDRAEPNSPEWMFLRDELRRLARPDPNYSSSLILGGMRVSASIFKPNIIP